MPAVAKSVIRWTLRLGILVIVALLLYFAVTISEGYLRAPRVVETHVKERPLALTRSDLSQEQLAILLAVEDPRFFDHSGIDVRTPGAGMTTITQGLVKFLYFDRFLPGLAKIRQTLLAIGFNARIDKDAQLAIFLNSAYLGSFDSREVLGFEEAARVYFSAPFRELTRDQFISLVAMCVGPNQFSVALRPEANAERVARIERLLRGECSPQGLRDVYYAGCAAAAR